jgi:hypothetical protein
MELWNDWNAWDPSMGATHQPEPHCQGAPQVGEMFWWPPKEEAPRIDLERKGKGKRRSRSISREGHRLSNATWSSRDPGTDWSSYFLSDKASASGLQQSTSLPGSSSGPLASHFPQQSTEHVSNPPTLAGGNLNWELEYPQQNELWHPMPSTPESSTIPSGVPAREQLYIPSSGRQSQPSDAFRFQVPSSAEQPGGRVRVPQVPLPHSLEVPDSEIRFDIENGSCPGVPFGDLAAIRPGLIGARKPAFPANTHRGSVVIWITVSPVRVWDALPA